MIARLEHPVTGETVEIAVNGLSRSALERLCNASRTGQPALREAVSAIPLAVEARLLLLDLAPLSIAMDGRDIPLGGMILRYVHEVYGAGELTPGRAVGAALETLLNTLPVCSWLLSLTHHPLMLFLGLPIGFSRNLDTGTRERLERMLRPSFAGLELIPPPNIAPSCPAREIP